MWARIIFPLLLTNFVLPQLPQARDDFSRQPAGQVILTRHDRSDSDPQQVHIVFLTCSIQFKGSCTKYMLITFFFFMLSIICQVHISLLGSDHIRVSWITDDRQAPSIVEYGTESGRYDVKARGVHTSYTYFQYSSGKIHHVKIGPLEPDTTYFYRCGESGPEFSFKTPPSTFPVEFVVVGKFI